MSSHLAYEVKIITPIYLVKTTESASMMIEGKSLTNPICKVLGSFKKISLNIKEMKQDSRFKLNNFSL